MYSGIEFHNYVCKYMNDVIMCSDNRSKQSMSKSPIRKASGRNTSAAHQNSAKLSKSKKKSGYLDP